MFLTPVGTVAVVETVEPVVLGTKVNECGCGCNEYIDFPECVRCCFDGDIVCNTNGPRIYVSLGIFSVIKVERPAQLLVQATDYSVPDKECTNTRNDNPCALFKSIAFPVSQFNGSACPPDNVTPPRGGCGCGK